MCGCNERNFECADELCAEGRVIASASVARSIEADWDA
jgi:hypothetical protein